MPDPEEGEYTGREDREGRRVGQGNLTWEDGSGYSGGWAAGLMEGQGVLLYMVGDYQARYVGSWSGGKPVSWLRCNFVILAGSMQSFHLCTISCFNIDIICSSLEWQWLIQFHGWSTLQRRLERRETGGVSKCLQGSRSKLSASDLGRSLGQMATPTSEHGRAGCVRVGERTTGTTETPTR